MPERRGTPVPCWECDGTGMTPTGGYTYDGQRLFSAPDCHLCEGTGKAMRFESMDDLIADLQDERRHPG